MSFAPKVANDPVSANTPADRLSLAQAVLTDRDGRVERGFHRLKGTPLVISPLLAQRDDPVVGLTHRLTLALRLLPLIELVVRRQLKMLRMIKQSLKVGVAYRGQVEPTTVGIPQGAPISPLYRNQECPRWSALPLASLSSQQS
jgi:hypothetical protein